MRVAAGVIIIVVLRDFTINDFLHVFYEFSAVHGRAGVYFNIILLIMVLTVLRFFMKLIIYN